MLEGTTFSYAIRNGEWVHVDEVPRGLDCNCVCPHCGEPLVARQGEIKEHGFAHHSSKREANLDICYRVAMYKLAEHIIQKEKCILTPSYYDIFKEEKIEFAKVEIDDRYDRQDKQPDVIATTKDGKQYLIEFIFQDKVQHKKAIDYKNTSCLTVNLADQEMDNLKDFLLAETKEKTWINNQNYFDRIEEIYHRSNKNILVTNEKECKNCPVKNQCCAVKKKESEDILVIENNQEHYRLCKIDLYKQKKEEHEKQKQKEREEYERRKQKERDEYERQKRKEYETNKNYEEWRSNLLKDQRERDMMRKK